MVTFLTVFHILVALVLICLVLVQDSKGGGALGMGGGSNSFLGATGAQTLAATLTKWTAVLFAVSCLALAAMISSQPKSVVDGVVLPPVSTPATTEVAPGTSTPTAAAGTEPGTTPPPAETPAPPSTPDAAKPSEAGK